MLSQNRVASHVASKAYDTHCSGLFYGTHAMTPLSNFAMTFIATHAECRCKVCSINGLWNSPSVAVNFRFFAKPEYCVGARPHAHVPADCRVVPIGGPGSVAMAAD